MEYERPDNINESLSKSLLGQDLNKDNKNYYIYIGIFFLILILLALLYYFFIYKANIISGSPDGGNLSTSTPVKNNRPTSTPTTASSTATSTTGGIIPGVEQLFYIIWPDAITGYTIVGSSTLFQDKNTGHIYRADAPDYKPYKIANTSINNLFLSQFADNGNTIIFQTLNSNNNTLSTYMADIAPYNGSPANLTNKAYLGDNVKSFDVAPDGKRIAYVDEDKKAWTSNIKLVSFPDRKVTNLATYQLPNIRLNYYSTNSLSIYQAPSKDKMGQGYIIDIKSGLIIPSMQGKALIYRPSRYGNLYNNSGGLFLNIGKVTTQLGFDTHSNKCNWSSAGTFILCAADTIYRSNNPDQYYNNSVIYSDNIYMHGIDYPEEKMIYNFAEYNSIALHIYNMRLSDDNQNLYMMDKLKGYYLLKVYPILSSESL